MGEYNQKKSISVKKLSEEELDIAIKDWAENDPSLENLLRTCYKNNIETIGCHVGPRSYLEFFVNSSYKKIINLLSKAEQINKSEVLLMPDGGNPNSGDDWYKPSLTLSFSNVTNEEVDNYFNQLSKSINQDLKEGIYSKILKLYDFLINKESSLLLRIGNKEKYYFEIELLFRNSKLDYFNELFKSQNLVYRRITDKVHSWKLEEIDYDVFKNKLDKIINYIINNYSLGLPEYSELESFSSKALYKKREFGDTEEGRIKLDKWIENNRR